MAKTVKTFEKSWSSSFYDQKKKDSQNALTLRIKVTCKVLEIVEKQDLSHRNSGLIGNKTSACCSKVHLYGLSCKMQ